MRLLPCAVLTGALLLAAAAPAGAAVDLSIAPSSPGVVVHRLDQDVPGRYTVSNTSTGAEATGTVTLSALSLLPTCGAAVPAAGCPGGPVDPNVFAYAPSAVGTGSADACAGKTFDVVVVDVPTGTIEFQPVGGAVVLGPPSAGDDLDSCQIDYTRDVLATPNHDLLPGFAGNSTAQIGAATGTHANGSASVIGVAYTTVYDLAVSIQPAGPVAVGEQLVGVALFDGGSPPVGTVDFSLHSSPTCDFGSDVPGASATNRPVSGGQAATATQATAPGTYYWRARYNDDSDNATPVIVCGGAVTVVKASPTLTITARPATTVGQPLGATATLTGRAYPTGTFTLQAFSDAGCTTQAFSATTDVAGGQVNIASPAAQAPGTFFWRAVYGGDANNNGASTGCNAPSSTQVVTKASPLVSVAASGSVPFGTAVSAVATLDRAAATAGGTMTFRLFSDAACTSQVATSAQPVNGLQVAASPVAVPVAGTYRWTVTYSGDAGHEAATSNCSDVGSDVAVTRATPTLTLATLGAVALGGTVQTTAALRGGSSPTGTITFRLAGPDDAGCAVGVGSPGTATVSANGDYTSDVVTPPVAGAYRWVASYSGDANNLPAATACADAFLVNAPPPVIAPKGKIVGTAGPDWLIGTPGDDVIEAGAGNDVIVAGDGDDVIDCGPGDDVVSGGAGRDTINCEGGDDRVDGGGDADRLTGGGGNDRLIGAGGDDRLSGNDGQDILSGGLGRDRLLGGAGRDTLRGGGGRDVLVGGPGRDKERQ